MSDKPNALRKKLRPPKPVRVPCHGVLERSADELYRKVCKNDLSLDVFVPEAEAYRRPIGDLLEGLEEICVTLLLNGPDGELGLCVIDGALNDGLIEQQTLGRIAKVPRGDRAVTEVDAAMCEPFIQDLLKQMNRDFRAIPASAPIRGFTCGRPIFDRPELKLLMTEPEMDVVRITLDLGPGVKTGCMELWFPGTSKPYVIDDATGERTGPTMKPHVLDTEVEMEAVLDNVKVPLSKIIEMSVGDTIEIPREALMRARLLDKSGSLVTRARLGQLNMMRAARVVGLNGPVKDSATGPMLGSGAAAAALAGVDEMDPMAAMSAMPSAAPAPDTDWNMDTAEAADPMQILDGEIETGDMPTMAFDMETVGDDGDDEPDFAMAPMSIDLD